MRVSFVVWLTEEMSVLCVCSIKFITEGTPPPPMNEYLNHFMAAPNAGALPALGALAFVIPHYRTNEFSCLCLCCATVELSVVEHV